MSSPFGKSGKGGIFYGWWLLAAGTAILVIHGGVFTYGFAAFFLPLAAALGTSRAAISLAFSFTRLENGLLGPIEGFFIDRFGPRKMLFVGFAMFGLGFLLFSLVKTLVGFYLVFAFMALGASMAGFLPVVTAVTNWFSRKRGAATGISAAGVNIGGMLVALVALAIATFDWRATAVGIGILVWVLGFPLSAMIRHRPQPYGYLPDGAVSNRPTLSAGDQDPAEYDGGRETLDEFTDEPSFTPLQALKTSAFWFISASHGFSVLVIGAVTVHQIPLLVDVGIPEVTAASIMAFMTAMAVVGRVSGGFVGDFFGRKRTLVVCFSLMSIGVIVLATAHSVPQALLFAVLYGLGYGARAPLLIALRGDFFGPRNFATIMGLSQPIMTFGSFLGPVAAGYAYDVQGNYLMVFSIIAAVGMIGAVLVLFIKKPTFKENVGGAR